MFYISNRALQYCTVQTSQRLQEQIQQHVSKSIRNQAKPQKNLPGLEVGKLFSSRAAFKS